MKDLAWVRALTLEERRDLLRAAAQTLPFDPGLKAARLSAWCAQPPFSSSVILQQRLACDDLDAAEFERILGTPDQVLLGLCQDQPPWLQLLLRVYEGGEEGSSIREEALRRDPSLGLLQWVLPLLSHFRGRVRSRLRRHPDCPAFQGELADLERMFCGPLAERLLKMVRKVLLLELSIAREAGRLSGESPEARYRCFVSSLRGPQVALGLFKKYPALARALITYAEAWCAAQEELIDRLAEDLPSLEGRLDLGSPLGSLRDVEGGVGDRHCGARAVTILHFEGDASVVYKPRPLQVESWVGRLLARLNEGHTSPSLSFPRVWERGGYGWCAFVPSRPCANTSEVALFYERLGRLLALLYALDASDVHYENLIACGAAPYVVDLECVFSTDFIEADPLRDPLGLLHASVLRTSLLPSRISLKAGEEGVETGGLSDVRGERTFRPLGYFEAEGSDRMRLRFEQAPLKPGRNRPTLRGEPVSLHAYTESLVRGFEGGYQALCGLREELIEPGGLLDQARELPVRTLLRLTLAYSYLLGNSEHPDVVRDGLDLDRHWDALWIGIQGQPLVAATFCAERAALRRQDIPLLGTLAGETTLWADRTCKLRAGLEQSGLERVREKISRMAPADRERQVWIIRAALATLDSEKPAPRAYALRPADPAGLTERCLQLSIKMGTRLAETALVHGGQANWLGLVSVSKERFRLAPLGVDLYAGLAGISLFLGYLAQATGEARFRVLGQQAKASLLAQLEARAPGGPSGAWTGVAGAAYALLHLGHLSADPRDFRTAEGLCEGLAPSLADDPRLDLLSGVAGLIPIFLHLHHTQGNPRLLALAIRAGERLLATAKPQPAGGVGWQSVSSQPLTGFSHGAAGIGWSLVCLWQVSQEERFKEYAQEAFAYERALFDSRRGFWPDLRDGSRPEGLAEGYERCAPGAMGR